MKKNTERKRSGMGMKLSLINWYRGNAIRTRNSNSFFIMVYRGEKIVVTKKKTFPILTLRGFSFKNDSNCEKPIA